MSTKLKKYLFLIPTLFLMLINCVCYGQVIAADESIDYSDYYLSLDSFPEILEVYDYSDYSSCSLSGVNVPKYSKYLYLVSCDPFDYDAYTSGRINYLIFKSMWVNIDESTLISNDFSFVATKPSSLRYADFTYSNGSITLRSSSACDNDYFYYFLFEPDTMYLKYSSGYSTSNKIDLSDSYFGCNRYILYAESNFFDLAYTENFVEPSLNIDVIFNPELSGEVDRSVTLDDGSTALKNSITMVVYNHSKFDIQYKMDIYRKEDLSEFATVAPGVYPVFTYYEKDWVYGNSLDNNADFWNKTEKQYKATSQHLIWSGRSDIVSFNFSQLPLSEGVNYTVVVRATRNDYKYPSEIVADYLEEPDPGRYQVSQSEVVFRSDFSMKQYSDVKYDHSDTSNGVLPFQGKDDKQKYENSYYAKEDDSGNVDYEGKDVYNDPDSWYNDKFNHDINHDKAYPGLVGDKESGGSSDGTFTSFASSFTNYFQFLAYIFNYFPVGMKNVFLIGFVGIMVIVVVKVIFK